MGQISSCIRNMFHLRYLLDMHIEPSRKSSDTSAGYQVTDQNWTCKSGNKQHMDPHLKLNFVANKPVEILNEGIILK